MAAAGWRFGSASVLLLALCILAPQTQAGKRYKRDLSQGKSVREIISELHGENKRGFGNTKELNSTVFSIEVTNSMLNLMQVELPSSFPNYKNPTWLEDHPRLDATVSETSFFHNCYNAYRHLLPSESRALKTKSRKQTVIRKRGLEDEDFAGGLDYNRRAACAPSFMVIGAHGLSANHTAEMLKLHSQHVLTVNFETHNYWDYRECTEAADCNADFLPPTFADYKSLHQAACEHTRRQSFFMEDGEEFHPDVVGDVFSGFLNWNPCWRKVPGNEHGLTPRVTSAHHVRALMPNIKMVMLMRDPIKKTWGLFRQRFDRRFPWSEEDVKKFHSEMKGEVKKFDKCRKKNDMTTKQCVYHFMDTGEDTILAQSIYHIFVDDYKTIFPEENIMFVRFEDFRHDENSEIDDVVHFLGVPSMRYVVDEDPTMTIDRGMMPLEKTMTMLHDFFRPHNEALKALIGDKYSWA